MKIKVILQELDKSNKNGRVYPKEVMERAIKSYYDTFVKENRALVEKQIPEQSVVNITNVIGKVNEIGIENDKVVAEIESLSTIPQSDEMFGLLKEGKLSARLSGMGTIKKKENGTWEIQPDYELISIFLTDTPA